MTTTVLRHQAKPEQAEENQQLIEAVFAELDEGELDGFTYKVFRLEDGVSFIHVWIEHDVADPDSLQVVPAFQAFMADLAGRCDVPRPDPPAATVPGGRVAYSLAGGRAHLPSAAGRVLRCAGCARQGEGSVGHSSLVPRSWPCAC
jgi:hypothetical protein